MNDKKLAQLRKSLREKTFGERLEHFQSLWRQSHPKRDRPSFADFPATIQKPNPRTIVKICTALELSPAESMVLIEPLLHQPLDTLAGQLQARRILSDMTLQEVGEKSGVDYTTVARIEKGRNIPQPSHFRSLLDTYRYSTQEAEALIEHFFLEQPKESFASQVRLIRLRHGMTPADLAGLAKVSTTFVVGVESGKEISPPPFRLLAEALYLLDGEQPRTDAGREKWIQQMAEQLLGNTLQTVGGQLQFWHYCSGKPQKDLAAALGVTTSFVGNVGHNRVPLPPKWMEKLTSFLEIPPDAKIHSMVTTQREDRKTAKLRKRDGDAEIVATSAMVSGFAERPILGRYTQMVQKQESGRGWVHE
jgi:transcriptional regulator with XRE-family HTH domain